MIKAVRDLIGAGAVAETPTEYSVSNMRSRAESANMGIDQVVEVIGALEKQMKEAAKSLDFERAAELRDEINELRRFVNPGDFTIPVAPKKPAGKIRRAR